MVTYVKIKYNAANSEIGMLQKEVIGDMNNPL